MNVRENVRKRRNASVCVCVRERERVRRMGVTSNKRKNDHISIRLDIQLSWNEIRFEVVS